MTRKRTLAIALAAISGMAATSLSSIKQPLIWNRTESAPLGLYWQSDGPLILDGWAVVSATAPDALWASARGYVGAGWPIIKQIRALPGDEVCREDALVSINGEPVATALRIDSRGRNMPVWHGCFTLKSGEVFLLNDLPASLDGRYFGASAVSDLSGTATLVWARR